MDRIDEEQACLIDLGTASKETKGADPFNPPDLFQRFIPMPGISDE